MATLCPVERDARYGDSTLVREEAIQLMQEARAANIKLIESSADSLRQTLEVARRRLNAFELSNNPRTSHLH